jgi:hypothetical protein
VPPAARRGNKPRKHETRPPENPPADPAAITVRMLVGANAGQVVRVTRAEAARLCDGWQPQAELVAVRRADQRETR